MVNASSIFRTNTRIPKMWITHEPQPKLSAWKLPSAALWYPANKFADKITFLLSVSSEIIHCLHLIFTALIFIILFILELKWSTPPPPPPPQVFFFSFLSRNINWPSFLSPYSCIRPARLTFVNFMCSRSCAIFLLLSFFSLSQREILGNISSWSRRRRFVISHYSLHCVTVRGCCFLFVDVLVLKCVCAKCRNSLAFSVNARLFSFSFGWCLVAVAVAVCVTHACSRCCDVYESTKACAIYAVDATKCLELYLTLTLEFHSRAISQFFSISPPYRNAFCTLFSRFIYLFYVLLHVYPISFGCLNYVRNIRPGLCMFLHTSLKWDLLHNLRRHVWFRIQHSTIFIYLLLFRVFWLQTLDFGRVALCLW